MDTKSVIALAGPVVTILTLLINQWGLAKKAARERDARAEEVKAELEREKLELDAKLQLRIAELDAENRHRFAVTTSKLDQTHEGINRVKRAIAENTDISVRAFDATNHVNEKIAAVPATLRQILEEQAEKSTQKRMESATRDIQERVVRIEDTITTEDE